MPIKVEEKKLYSVEALAKILPITSFTIRAYFRKEGERWITALSSEAHNNRGIKTNNIYLKTIIKGMVLLTIPSLKPL